MNDHNYMQLAIQLAKSAQGQTTPNPIVGAIVVKDHHIVGMGAHLKAGEPHAEVHALHMAGDNAKGSTVYVTLEPCSHYGRTPPCAKLLVEKGVKRVVIATTDPNPKVAGRGIDLLKKAGIDVEVGLMKMESDEMNQVFYHYISTKTPFVTLKSATSLDGKIATVTGESQWITGEKAREDVHYYRHIHDAILVGVGTVIADNPSLTTRLPYGGKHPIRIILDHHLRTPLDANVISDQIAETWLITSSTVTSSQIEVYRSKGVTVIQMTSDTIRIRDVLILLGERGISSLFVEGGAKINGSFLVEKAVNQVITYIAPKLIGGQSAPTSFGGSGIENIEEVLSLEIKHIEKIGDDLKIISIPKGDK